MVAYYNEIDPYAAQWLRNLIAAGHIAPGDVDERSIEDVHPDDLRTYTQCHFFAGIGVWSFALRNAGWADDRSVWTGSCPCQPFSTAGKGSGFDDERHLWPAWYWLIQECRPTAVFGEQVASKNADPWIDLVHADLEAMGYAFGAVPFPSASVGAPHIRDRVFWVANDCGRGLQERQRVSGVSRSQTAAAEGKAIERRGFRSTCGLADLHNDGRQQGRERPEAVGHGTAIKSDSGVSGLEHASGQRREWRETSAPGHDDDRTASVRPQGEHGIGFAGAHRIPEHAAGPVNGFWRNADWLLCRDGKWRPVEPGAFPLAHGATSRVGRLRAYGNAINSQAAQAFIESVMEVA